MLIMKFAIQQSHELCIMEIRVGPSKESSPPGFHRSNSSFSQTSRTTPISRDQTSITSTDSSMTELRSVKEAKSTCRRVFVVMSESFGGSLPVNKSSIEGTSRTTISQTNKVITQSSVFTVVSGGQVSSGPSNSFSASSRVLEASRAVASIRWGRGDISAAGIASSSRNKSATDESS
jgi:hypothetical protein